MSEEQNNQPSPDRLTGVYREIYDRLVEAGPDARERLGQAIQGLAKDNLSVHEDVLGESLKHENFPQLLPELLANPQYRARLMEATSPEQVRQVVGRASEELANGGSDSDFNLADYRRTAEKRRHAYLTNLQRRPR